MNDIALTFRDAELEVMNAVLTACSRNRDAVARTHEWAPRVHCSGHRADRMIYHVQTAPFSIVAAQEILAAAREAEAGSPAQS
jgi:hypothetical protein